MRANELQRLKECVEKQKGFLLIPYSNSPNLTFEANKGFWFVHSYEFLSYPEKIEVKEEPGVSPTLCCYYEGGFVLGYEFNLDNFFQVKKVAE